MHMTQPNRFPSQSRQRGLTLLELLVVLVVLVALAGILTPLLPSVLTRSHGAAGADNIKEIVKAVQLYEATEGGQPTNWDSLIDANGVVAATSHLVELDLSAAGATEDRVREALFDAGIVGTLQHTDFTDGGINQTFEGTGGAELTITDASTATGGVATLTPAGVAALGLEAVGGDGPVAYVAFGLGAGTSAIGKTMVDAPVHFLEGGESPIEEYARWAVIYAVPSEGPVRIASVAGIEEGEEFAGMDKHLAEYYEATE